MSNEFSIKNDDCIEWMIKAKDKGIKFDLSIFSPPFSSLYVYSKHPADMGNSKESDDEFLMHFKFFTDALFPLIKDGRNVCVHVQNPSRSLTNHGYIGIWDMRGEMIKIFEQSGFNYYGEATIFKNPQVQSIRTKTHCLSFTQMVKDSLKVRPALADYLLIFKKGYSSEIPVNNNGETRKNSYNGIERIDITNDDWINWASPIWCTDYDGYFLPYQTSWFNIRETNTLNFRMARTEEDERHLCPLQLDLIERCVKLYSNKGECIFSPFTGIGSEGYISLKNNRKFFGIELKKEYYDIANNNCEIAIKERESENIQKSIF